mgnify:CR=1 FL=1
MVCKWLCFITDPATTKINTEKIVGGVRGVKETEERAHQALVDGTVRIDDATWTQIGTISRRLGIDAPPRIDT